MASTAAIRFFQSESDTFDADLLLAAAAAMSANVAVSDGYIRLLTPRPSPSATGSAWRSFVDS